MPSYFRLSLFSSIRGGASSDLSTIRGKLPLLAVCYGAQYLAHFSGGAVKPSNTREYGRANLSFIQSGETFFEGVDKGSQVWMSHSDTIDQLPDRGILLASTKMSKTPPIVLRGKLLLEFSFTRRFIIPSMEKYFWKTFD